MGAVRRRLALARWITDSRNPLTWLKAGTLLAVRHVATHWPDPGAAFARVAPLYALACNNAVLGAEPGHPLIQRLLARIRQMPRSRALRSVASCAQIPSPRRPAPTG